MLADFELVFAALMLALAAWLRPWRMLNGPLLSPFLAGVVLLPWFWLLPQMLPSTLHAGGVAVQLSGASLLTLMLGWPLAVVALVVVAMVVWIAGSMTFDAWLAQWVWMGLVPAVLAVLVGAVLRRWLPTQVFVYIFGRGFLGTALCVFGAGLLYELAHYLADGLTADEALVARWLMAWGDAVLTGMLVAIFVAFKPEWLATWSDRRYLQKPPAGTAAGFSDDPPAPPALALPPDEPDKPGQPPR